MNERIAELEKQTWSEVAQLGLVKWNDWRDKFAELIVRECCQKLENDGMVEVAMELKEHFGVE
jgi:hypothetical protein